MTYRKDRTRLAQAGIAIALIITGAIVVSKPSSSREDAIAHSPERPTSDRQQTLEHHAIHEIETFGSRTDDRGRNALKTARDFENEFLSIDKNLTGLELRKARLQLIALAGQNLDIGSLQALADSLRSKVYHSGLSGLVALKYANDDPEKGIEWLIQESGFEDSSSASLAFAASHTFDSFPKSILDRFLSNKKKALFLEGLMKQASVEITREALKYIQDHPEVGRQNGNLIASSFDTKLEKGEFTDALVLCSSLNNPSLKNQILGKVFDKTAAQDPAIALALLSSIHQGTERSIAITAIATSWGYSEPDKVADWAGQLSTSQDRDSAKAGLAEAISHVDPSSAMEWARSISNHKQREILISKLMATLSITDPDWAR